jgi:DNA-binding transcriptional LysR family regulator
MVTSDLRAYEPGGEAPSESPKPVGAALAYRQMGEPTQRQEGEGALLRIGLCSSLGRGFLRELIRHVRADLDAPHMSFLEGSPQAVVDAVNADHIDIGFVYGAHDLPALESEELWREQLMVLMPDGHRLARYSDVKPTVLREETFLVAGGSTESEMHTELLERAIGGTPVVLAVPVERATVIDLVSLGFGLAVAIDSALGVFHPGVTYRPIGAPVEPVAFHAVWGAANRNRELPRFLETARDIGAIRRG